MEKNEKWEIVLNPYNKKKVKGVRAEGGFVCLFPDIYHYPGQDERYQEELAEDMERAELIVSAPKLQRDCKALLEACHKICNDCSWRGRDVCNNCDTGIAISQTESES